MQPNVSGDGGRNVQSGAQQLETSIQAQTLALSIVANAERLGLIWKLRPATVVAPAVTGTDRVIIDGDDQSVPVRVTSLVGTLTAAQRVMVLITPPSGLHVIGRVDNYAWATMTLVSGWAGTFRVRLVPSPPHSIQVAAFCTPGTKADGTPLTTLTAPYRPLTSIDVPVAVGSMAGATAESPHLAITTNGVVKMYGCSGTNAIHLTTVLGLDNP
jgi:hypothetical protein